MKTFLCNFSDIIKISLQMKLQNQHEIIKNRPCLFSFVWWIVFVVVTVEMKQKLSLLCCCDQFLAKFICLFIFSAYNTRETRSRCTPNWFLPKSMVFNGSGWIVQILEIIKFWSCLSSYSNTAKVKNVQNYVFFHEPLFRGWKMKHST